MALEGLHVNIGKNKPDPDEIKLESMSIATVLRDEILNMKEDFKIIMSIKKGKVMNHISSLDHSIVNSLDFLFFTSLSILKNCLLDCLYF